MAAPKNPKAQGSKSDKEWRDAIRLAVHEVRTVDEDGKPAKVKALRLLARSLISKALDGDVSALKEIGDRLDGKAVQGVEMSGPEGGPVQVEDMSPTEAARRLLFALRVAMETSLVEAATE